jgi:hypothetical protein
MPSSNPTGYETYIYDHKQYPSCDEETRQHCGKLHDPKKLPPPTEDHHTSPLFMVEPSYSYATPNDVVIMGKFGPSLTLTRYVAEQLRDAFIKVCEKSYLPQSP